MNKFIFIFAFFASVPTHSQLSYMGSELGLEPYVGFSNMGGAVGGELKYAARLSENLLVGPSLRVQRTWANNLGVQSQMTTWGGGVFAHYRYQDLIFGGVEFQYLKSPFSFVNPLEVVRPWSPTLMVGGGFYLKLTDKVRLNAALFYDVINAPNSPFRSSYTFQIKNEFGQVVRILPIIYRLTFFIPLDQHE
ncbi:MAG: hypothetical protein LW839_05760 [Cryomorphaceae bacterium]|nr:hypothetical protein [Cryomorphaceae bacterium]